MCATSPRRNVCPCCGCLVPQRESVTPDVLLASSSASSSSSANEPASPIAGPGNSSGPGSVDVGLVSMPTPTPTSTRRTSSEQLLDPEMIMSEESSVRDSPDEITEAHVDMLTTLPIDGDVMFDFWGNLVSPGGTYAMLPPAPVGPPLPAAAATDDTSLSTESSFGSGYISEVDL